MRELRHERDKRFRWWPRRPSTVGRRGGMLLLLGILWSVVGIAVFYEPTRGTDYILLHQYLPTWIRAGAWIGCGVLAIVYAFRPHGRSDAPAWLALYVMPAERCISYAWAWLDFYLPLGGPGLETGWIALAIYLVFLGVVLICAGWPEPPDADLQEE